MSSALIGCIIEGILSGFFPTDWDVAIHCFLHRCCFLFLLWARDILEALFFPQGEVSLALLITFNIYRILGGIGVGLASAVSPMYISEISPAEIRGRLVSFNQFAIIFGMLVVYFVNWSIARGQSIEWINAIGFGAGCLPPEAHSLHHCSGILLLFVPGQTSVIWHWYTRTKKPCRCLRKSTGVKKPPIVILNEIKQTVDHSIKASVFSYGEEGNCHRNSVIGISAVL